MSAHFVFRRSGIVLARRRRHLSFFLCFFVLVFAPFFPALLVLQSFWRRRDGYKANNQDSVEVSCFPSEVLARASSSLCRSAAAAASVVVVDNNKNKKQAEKGMLPHECFAGKVFQFEPSAVFVLLGSMFGLCAQLDRWSVCSFLGGCAEVPRPF